MEGNHRIEVPLRSGGKKMKKRRELDALITTNSKRATLRPLHSHDKLLSASTDDAEDYTWMDIARKKHLSKKKSILRMCWPFLLAIASVLYVGTLYWLYFDMRQQIYDYRQKIDEVSSISKNFPDTLQKWHETTSYLMKNQSATIEHLNDFKKSIDGLRSNFSNIEATLLAQRNFERNEKLVADFGAKLEAIASDVESIRDRYNKYAETQKKFEFDIDELKTNFSIATMWQPLRLISNYSHDVEALNQSLKLCSNQLNSYIQHINNTFSQKTKVLHDELLGHKIKLDDLSDRSENITSHVTTLSNRFPEYNLKIIHLNDSLDKIEKEIFLTKSINSDLASSIKQLNKFCKEQITSKKVSNEEKLDPEQLLTNVNLQNDSSKSLFHERNATTIYTMND